MKDRKIIETVEAMVVILLFALGITVWPTRYRMERVSIGTSPSVLVRIDRFTGKAEMLTRIGWRPMENTLQENTPQVNSGFLPADQVERLDSHGGWCISNDFCIDIYNGSNWRINGMSISILAKNDDGSVRWQRRFDKKYLDIAPFATDKFFINTGEKAPQHEWYILSVEGKEEVPKTDFDYGRPDQADVHHSEPAKGSTSGSPLGTLRQKRN